LTTNPTQTKAADLAVGTWISTGDGPAEVLLAQPFTDSSGPGVYLTYRYANGAIQSFGAGPATPFEIISETQLAHIRTEAERARKIADIRTVADWLEANPDIPMAYGIGGQADLSDSQSYSAAEVDAVRAFAEKHGGEFREGEDHTSARVRFGDVTYSLISWHKDGRPAEPKPLTPDTTADERVVAEERKRVEELGLNFTRADDDTVDPTPTGPREPLHTGGMTESGLVDETPIDAAITGAAVTEACVFVGDKGGWCKTHEAVHIATMAAECGCPVYPYAGRGDAADTIVDHRRDCPGHPYAGPVDETGGYWPPRWSAIPIAEPVHMDLVSGESMCGLAATTPHKGLLVWRDVTCQACIDAAGS
jgi:hypothetical protein